MPLFRLIEEQTITATIETEAENEDEAAEKYMSGDCWTVEIDESSPELIEVIEVE